ncbi:MAG: TolC family protein [Clostridiales bacterium]|nr:TolC family protein [Clostridiales bacterium]
MKKTTTIVLGIMMLTSFSFAKDITLDEAISLAIENNSSVISLTAEQRQQESDYKSVVKDTRIWQNKQAYSFETANEYLLYTGDRLEEAQLKYDTYLKSIENAQNSAEYNLISTLYNLELAERNIELLEKNVEILEKQKLVHELKLQLKMITQIDLDNFLLSYNEAKNTLNNAKNQYELGKENLKIMLGQTEDVNVILPEIQIKLLEIEDIDKFISENINNNKTILELRYNYKTLENKYIGFKEGLFSDLEEAQMEAQGINIKLQTKVLGDSYEALGAQLNLATNNMSTLYKSYYNNIKTSELEMTIKYNKLELAKKNMQVVQTRYDAGYVAELDYKSAKLGLEQSEIEYRTAVINNMLLNLEFERFVETGFTKGK